MIQTGGFDSNMRQLDTGRPIKNEADNGLSNKTGTLAMARTMDRLSPPKNAFSVFAMTSLGRSAGVGGARHPPPLICDARRASLPAIFLLAVERQG